MAEMITQEDLLIALQQSAAPTLKLKIEVLDLDQRIIGHLEPDITSGSMSISGESDIRRTANFVVQPTLKEKIKLEENGLLWLNKDIRLSVGLYNPRTRQYKYYPLGYYVYTDTSGTYDATNDNLTINCADFMKKLDGTKNGQLGILKLSYPAYEEDPDTGEVIQYYTIRNAVINVLENLAHITNHRIDDIGVYEGFPEYNDDWQEYREGDETWNTIPFDQEFSSGCSVLSILTAFRDLYPNYEMFFDMETNTFVCQLKPLCYEDDIYLDNTFLQRVLISENTSVDMTTVRNICEVWGKALNEVNFYSDKCSYKDNIYSATDSSYKDGYSNGDLIGLKIPAANQADAKININNFGAIGIYNEANEKPITADELKPDTVYAFQIKKQRVKKQDEIRAYLLGEWQVHAINVLTNGRKSGQYVTIYDDDDAGDNTTDSGISSSDSENKGTEYELYSKEYFQKVYNCDRVDMTIIPNSPFVVEKLGEILDVKVGNEYENVTSNDLAADKAKWENWKNCRLTDNITITTALLPFLDVNKKVSYKPSDSDQEHQYIINSISHDFSGYTTTITMYRFYPMFESLLKEAGTHKTLAEYSHGVLSKYTHEELTALISDEEL